MIVVPLINFVHIIAFPITIAVLRNHMDWRNYIWACFIYIYMYLYVVQAILARRLRDAFHGTTPSSLCKTDIKTQHVIGYLQDWA